MRGQTLLKLCRANVWNVHTRNGRNVGNEFCWKANNLRVLPRKKHDHGGVTVIGLLLQPCVSQRFLMRTVAGAVFRAEAELSVDTLACVLSPSSTSFHILLLLCSDCASGANPCTDSQRLWLMSKQEVFPRTNAQRWQDTHNLSLSLAHSPPLSSSVVIGCAYTNRPHVYP